MAASGMAASIRGATESETFDLAGNSVPTITSTISSAFAEPLNLPDMIRITFITGAGKLGRQKYDDNAAKTVTSTLRELGYEEDRAASCVVECGGTFKLQHDTGKNLKTVVVFPKIAVLDSGADGLEGEMGDMSLSGNGDALLPEGSPEHMITMSSPAVFGRMLASKCQSWEQKKGCSSALQEVKKLMESLDAKLLSGTPFTDPEQDLYDAVSVDSLTQKEALVKAEMQKQVEEGKITRLEKSKLLKQVQEKIESLEKEIKTAKEEKKPKKVDKLSAQKEKACAREKMLEDITPQPPHALRHEPEIGKLRKEMKPLLKLENETKGRLLSLKETTTLARKDEIMEEIAILEEKSRGWFEDDEAFDARVAASRAIAAARDSKKVVKKKPASGSSGGGFKTKPVSNWVTPGATKKLTGTKKSKARNPAQGNAFAAMMMDSDSD